MASTIRKINKAGIICAMELEAEGILSAMTDIRRKTVSGIAFREGTLGKTRAVVAVCGIGKVFAAICTEAMILNFAPDFIINTGVAGGLEPGLNIGDAVLATSLVQHDMDTSPLGDPAGMISGINLVYLPAHEGLSDFIAARARELGITLRRGIIASGDQFISGKAEKDRIREQFGASACEMEGASVAHVCYVNDVPFAVLRSISDGGDDGAATDYAAFAKSAAEKAAKIIKGAFS